MRFFIHFAYNGTAYHGWQYQPNAISVQQVLEQALETLLRTPVTLTAAGRTDTGVHARSMYAHFDIPDLPSPADITFRLAGVLPPDISVYSIRPVRADAHARFDALSRTYEYWVTDTPNPYANHLLTFTRYHLNYDLMNEAAAILLQERDFASFCKAHSDNKTTFCHVTRAFWDERPMPFMPHETCHVFTIEADRFLRNMVRAVVGTLFEVGRGRMTIEHMRQAIEAHDRCAAGQSMPPDGLYLTDIRYSDDIFL
ncbi:MAG: tRNA pseudouridine(38-40) synthase TruA [Paludibacteraceae bacterium]|nr:tRNA pseudouridine(38-40) synthase TruA [Paludibacteraceae bacterium]